MQCKHCEALAKQWTWGELASPLVGFRLLGLATCSRSSPPFAARYKLRRSTLHASK